MKAGLDYPGVTTVFYCHDGQGNFLLHKRSQNCRDEQGRWDAGGGKLEFGVSLEENVLREVKEEYGCVGVIEEQLPPLDIFREHDGAKTHWVAVTFFVRVNRDEARNNEPESIDEIGWFRLDNLPAPLHTGLQHTIKTLAPYFEKYRVAS
jgi:8-oxo-dGTP diphosphatase